MACWSSDAAELTNKANWIGERTVPRGTPDVGVKWSEEVESTVTHWILLETYEQSQESRGSPMPKESRVDLYVVLSCYFISCRLD